MYFFLFTICALSILPDQGNNQHENILHGPRILPDIIQNRLNNFISKFTIKLVPKKYANLIKSQHITSNKHPNEADKQSIYSIDTNNRNTDFIFYTTFSILCLSILMLFFIFVYQIANRSKKIIQK